MDLSGVTMDDEDDGPSHSTPTPEPDGVVILAQPAANPPTPVSNIPVVLVDIEDQQADRNPADDPAS